MTAPYPGGGEAMPPQPAPSPPAAATSGGGSCLGAGLAVVGVLLLLAAGALTAFGYAHRDAQTNPAWVNGMWRNAPAEKLFPENIAMSGKPGTASGGKAAAWYRVGIAPETSCRSALSKRSIDLATKAGCVAAPRATYVDATGNMVATIALVTLKPGKTGGDISNDPNQLLGSDLQEARNKFALVNAYPVPGTPAAHWRNDVRNGAGVYPIDDTPIVLVATTGSTDSRLAGRLPEAWNLGSGGTEDRVPWAQAADGLLGEFSLWYSHVLNEDTDLGEGE